MNNPTIKLISHASILIKAEDKQILTDPWFFGTAFNDGWELYPKPNLSKIEKIIPDIDIIWISHEHPDHLHFPTLKWLFTYCKKDIKIFFQSTNSSKVFDALKKIGFKNFVTMPHRKKIRISANVELGCYAHRHLDSSLAVLIKNNFWLLNINDTELDDSDISIILKDWGNPSVLFNQFSIAGFEGIENSLSSDASLVLDRMIQHHKGFNTNLTVPFASFITFARTDNSFMNTHANSPFDTKRRFEEDNCTMCLTSYESDGLIWEDVTKLPINLNEIDKLSKKEFKEVYSKKNIKFIDNYDYKNLSVEEVIITVENRLKDWKKNTSSFYWKMLKPFRFCITDWSNDVWVINFEDLTFKKENSNVDFDILIKSQPLANAFLMPFGIQPLGVSGRYQFHPSTKAIPKTWKLIRILSSLFNANIFISIKGLFSFNLLKWAWLRRKGLLSQIYQQFSRFFN